MKLGTNNAAQLHAEQAVKYCTFSHWDTHGLKPYMRYSLTGGIHANGENLASRFNCHESIPGFVHPAADAEETIDDLVQGLMESPGHRETMLHPDYSTMNAGIAWDEKNFQLVQHFETDFVEFDQGPTLSEGLLSLKGSTKGIPEFSNNYELWPLVLYDPRPERMRINRLARTSCYSPGDPIIAIREKASAGKTYSVDSISEQVREERCPDPYEMKRSLPAPESTEEMEELGEKGQRGSQRKAGKLPDRYTGRNGVDHQGNGFQLEADISKELEKRGPGIYTIYLFTRNEDDTVTPLAEKSFFHEVRIPRYYTANASD